MAKVCKGTKGRVFLSQEVILSTSAFNTPQLFKLSGIGLEDELERHKISVLVVLPGGEKSLRPLRGRGSESDAE